MKYALSGLLLVCLSFAAIKEANAIVKRRAKAPKFSQALVDVCPNIQPIDVKKQFWKNNKPLRASSAINAPVIGYYKQMTLANNAGYKSTVGKSTATLYDSEGNVLTKMTPYPCRADHCGGRVVSRSQTHVARRLAIEKTNKPTGYVKVSKDLCIKIDDIGRCYGNEVDKTRPLCNQVVG